jgi:hypothetical protein
MNFKYVGQYETSDDISVNTLQFNHSLAQIKRENSQGEINLSSGQKIICRIKDFFRYIPMFLNSSWTQDSAGSFKKKSEHFDSMHEVSFLANKQAKRYRISPGRLLPYRNRDFKFSLTNREITVMGNLAGIDNPTWKKIIDLGHEYLLITNRNWYQSNDDSWMQCEILESYRSSVEIIQRLKKEPKLKQKCREFIEKCPSRWYRAMVRMVLDGHHWTSGHTGNKYEGHMNPK